MKRAIVIRTVTGIVVLVFVLGTWIQDGHLNLSPIKFFSTAVLMHGRILPVGHLDLEAADCPENSFGPSKRSRYVERGAHLILG
jgi:hypothetical protein